jgi:serine/threonine-protein kinase RsbW
MPAESPGRADVELRLPAEGVYASVLRTTCAGLAARLDFTIEEIEDLRIAVSEAASLVLPEARPGGDLVGEFRLAPGTLRVRLTVPTPGPVAPDEASFAWQVLTTLVDEVRAETGPDRLSVRFSVTSALAPEALA